MDVMHQAQELFRLPTFEVAAWFDPIAARSGIASDSDEALLYVMPVIGPTGSAMLHRCSRYVSDGSSQRFVPAEFSATFGVMPSIAWRAVGRLMLFGMARLGTSGLEVRTHVPRLNDRWLDKIPSYLADAYRKRAAAA